MAKGLTIEATGLADVIKKVRELGDKKKKVTAELIQETAFNIAAESNRAAPVDMGALHGSTHVTQVTTMGATVEVLKNYAAYVEFGTGGMVNVPQGLEQYAMTFKGKGIK